MKISIFSEVRKINQTSEINQCFQRYSLTKTLHKKNIFNVTFLFESKKEPQNFWKLIHFSKKTCVKRKMLFTHNNTSLLHICFCVVKDKKDSATAGHFKIDKLTSSINNKRNTKLYHGTIIWTNYSSYYTIL